MTRTAQRLRLGRSADAGGFDRKPIAPMILGSILNPIDSSMPAVALVPIGEAFGAPPSRTVWRVSALSRHRGRAAGHRPHPGGLLIGTGGRHLIFAFNVPLSVARLVLGAVRLPKLATYGRRLLAYTTAYAFLVAGGRPLTERVESRARPAADVVRRLRGDRRHRPHAKVLDKLVVGAVVRIAGCAALLLLDASSSVWLLASSAPSSGVPQGLNGLADQNAPYAQADPPAWAPPPGWAGQVLTGSSRIGFVVGFGEPPARSTVTPTAAAPRRPPVSSVAPSRWPSASSPAGTIDPFTLYHISYTRPPVSSPSPW